MINRRQFLYGASFIALIAGIPAYAGINNPGGAVATPIVFTGNPNVLITGTPAGSIADSRTGDGSTFQTPFFVQVSASGITASGTSAPYEDLSFHWDFGDPSGTETFVRPTDGVLVTANNCQNSPEAAYCYRTAGTKTVTLTVTALTAGGYTVTKFTKSWTIAAFAPAQTFWFDPTAGGTNSGTLANPYNSMASLNTAMAANPINTQILINRGTHYTGTVGLKLNVGGLTTFTGFRIGAYGSGANPIIETTSGTFPDGPFQLANGGASDVTPQNDIVVSSIDFKNSGIAEASAILVTAGGNNTNIMKNIYFDNVNATLTADANSSLQPVISLGSNPDNNLTSNFGLWSCAATNPTTSTTISIGILGSAVNWHFEVGGSVTGAGTSNTFDHHVYPDTRNHGLWSLINFGASGTGSHQRSFCINGNWDGPRFVSNNQIAQYNCMADNNFFGTSFGFDLGNATNNTNPGDDTVQFQYAVIEKNAFNGVGGSLFGCGLSVTVRYNRWWGCTTRGDWYSPVGTGQIAGVAQTTHLLGKVYFNKLYVPAAAPSGAVLNLPDSGWTSPQVHTDNIIVDARATAQIQRIISSDHITSGSVIDRNTYYATTGYTTPWTDNVTLKTFAQWQALGSTPARWDASGTNLGSATPNGWTLPVTSWAQMGP